MSLSTSHSPFAICHPIRSSNALNSQLPTPNSSHSPIWSLLNTDLFTTTIVGNDSTTQQIRLPGRSDPSHTPIYFIMVISTQPGRQRGSTLSNIVNYKRMEKELRSPSFVLLHSTKEVMALRDRLENIMNTLTRQIRQAENVSSLDKRSLFCCEECVKSPCSDCRRFRRDRETVSPTIPDMCRERKIVDSIIDQLDDVLVEKSVRAYVNGSTQGRET